MGITDRCFIFTLELIQLLEFEQYKNNIYNIYHVLISRVGFNDTIYALSLEKFNVLLEYIEDYLPYENKSFYMSLTYWTPLLKRILKYKISIFYLLPIEGRLLE